MWTLTDSFTRYAITPAVAVVKRALERGFAGEAAIAFINAQPEVAVIGLATVCPAGSPWQSALMWYGKGDGYDGKFQYVKPDGPYTNGWAVRWTAWVDGPVPDGYPVGQDGKHPTAWEVIPEGAYDPSIPIPGPQPEPDPGGDEPTPGTDDLAALLAEVKALRADLAAFHVEFPDYKGSNRWLGAITLTPVQK